MTLGFAPSAASRKTPPPPSTASSPLVPVPSLPAAPTGSPPRTVGAQEWSTAKVPLLGNPREVVTGLYERHRPAAGTVVVGVLDPDERLRASASFTRRPGESDGWVCRNTLLAQLRRVLPHDLRRRTPVRTAVLLHCREGESRWTVEDGAWMWGLRDACTLHGLRCGAYVTLTGAGWQVLGEGRGGRHPQLGSRATLFVPRTDKVSPLPGQLGPLPEQPANRAERFGAGTELPEQRKGRTESLTERAAGLLSRPIDLPREPWPRTTVR
ncbi:MULTISPECIES: hypothetical protein [unclassified Streptomyces]|uniref:hypothetical protein n=1 Tax=unclassified Streptomyces TaxID=2593676 RepID=UPI000A50A190